MSRPWVHRVDGLAKRDAIVQHAHRAIQRDFPVRGLGISFFQAFNVAVTSSESPEMVSSIQSGHPKENPSRVLISVYSSSDESENFPFTS